MKKLLLLSLFSAMGINTYAASDCSIPVSADDKIIDIINENQFEFENYKAVCQRLKNANARVNLSYSSNINDRQTTAIVIATVKDKNLPIQSSSYSTSMWSNPERTSAVERRLLMGAVNGALEGIIQKDIDSLNENRKKLGFQTYPASTSTNKK